MADSDSIMTDPIDEPTPDTDAEDVEMSTAEAPRPKAKLYYKDIQAAESHWDQVQWQAPENDSTIPTTLEQQQAHVSQITAAMKNLDGTSEAKGNAYFKRWAPGQGRYEYTNEQVEACAWKIMNMARIIHVDGFTSIDIFDTETLAIIAATKGWIFQQRIDKICEHLARSKTACTHLMKGEKFMTVVGNPEKLAKVSAQNKLSNGRRNKWVKEGRERDNAQLRGISEEAQGSLDTLTKVGETFSLAPATRRAEGSGGHHDSSPYSRHLATVPRRLTTASPPTPPSFFSEPQLEARIEAEYVAQGIAPGSVVGFLQDRAQGILGQPTETHER